MDIAAAEKLVHTHFKAWRERDAVTRLSLLREVYTPDALLNDPMNFTCGLESISEVIEGLQGSMVGFTFRPSSPVALRQDAIRVAWECGPPEKPAAVTGQDFLLLRDGKIAAVYAFVDKPVHREV